jgi:SPP1 gp7 family putative phage head morphogenesis protein
MKTASEILLDSYLLRGILTERIATMHASKIIKEYKKILDDIVKRLQKEDAIALKDMNKIINEIKAKITPDITLLTDLQGLALSEASFIQGAVAMSAGISIIDKLPPESTLLRIANQPLFMGNSIMEVFTQFNDKLKMDLQGEIRQSVIQGESVSQIKKRVRDRFGVVGNQATTIARTATATLVNNVRQSVYDENEDIFKGYQHHATLDGRTTFVCANRDGLTWDIERNPIKHNTPFARPPLHPNCRSLLIPIMKSYRELGLDIDEISEGTRASMDGQTPSSTTFTKWFDGKDKEFQEKYLGAGRFQLYKSGAITIGQLINKDGEMLTLKELNTKYQTKFA